MNEINHLHHFGVELRRHQCCGHQINFGSILVTSEQVPLDTCQRTENAAQSKTPSIAGRFEYISLTMSYFHTGTRTIIGAEAFHCPVRDGKEWDHLAMVIRLNLLPSWGLASQANSQSIKSDILIA